LSPLRATVWYTNEPAFGTTEQPSFVTAVCPAYYSTKYTTEQTAEHYAVDAAVVISHGAAVFCS
jgi:hypothetical protein